MSLVNYPTIRPSLILDFQKAEVVDPRVTFTRASTATFFNNAGVLTSAANNIPRIDFNPSTLVCNGLLIEEARTNLLTYSAEFNNAAWLKSNSSITANTIVAPDGTVDADKLVEDATSATHFVRQNSLSTVGVTYVSSVYLKAAERTSAVVVHFDGSVFYGVSVNLSTGALSAPPSDLSLTDASSSATVTSVGNGWYRVSVARAQVSTTTTQLRVALQSGSNGVYTGNGTSGIYIWGAQLEAGAFPTSYIPTTTTALTRNADVASMTGTNFSSWFNASEGTIFCQGIGVNNVAAGTRRYFEINNNTPDERVLAGYGFTTACRYLVLDGAATQADIGVTTTTGGALVKFAGAYKTNDFQQASNGTLGTADTSGTLPTVDRMFIGQAETTAAATMLNGYIQRIAYYPVRLPNSTLQALTDT
jgi:hypothetical protein